MKALRNLFLGVVVLLCMTTIASASPVSCTNQTVVVGLTCSVGDLTFLFEAINFTGANSSMDSLSFETPPTSSSAGVVVLGFQVLATYPVDIHLDYLVTSTSSNITAIDNSFGPPFTGSIFETACPTDPTIVPPGCGTPYATITNTTGAFMVSPSFGPVRTVFIDKDVTDRGFSSFTDSVEESSSVPEPSTTLALGAALCGLGLVSRKWRGR